MRGKVCWALATMAGLVFLTPVAEAGPPDRDRLVVVDRHVLPAPSTDCGADTARATTVPELRRGAEASPVLVANRNTVHAVWQQDVGHRAAAFVTTDAATLSNGLGGPCGTRVPLAGASVVGPPSMAVGSDARAWTVVNENGSGANRVLLTDGRRDVVVEEQPPSPLGNLEVFPATVAVAPDDPDRIHVVYPINVFPAGTVSVHRVVDASTGAVSDAHPLWYGPSPAGYVFREQVVALGDGRLVALSTEVDPATLPTLAPSYVDRMDLTQAPVVVRVKRSSDDGVTWSLPETVLTLANGAVRDAEGGTALRSLVHPSVAVGRDGRILVAGESVGPEVTELLVTSSDDGGVTWTPATPVRRAGRSIAASVAIDGTGRVALSWLDVDDGLRAVWRARLLESGPGTVVDLSDRFSLRDLAPAYVGDNGALVGLRRGFAAAVVVATDDASDPSDVILVRLR